MQQQYFCNQNNCRTSIYVANVGMK